MRKTNKMSHKNHCTPASSLLWLLPSSQRRKLGPSGGFSTSQGLDSKIRKLFFNPEL